MSDKEQIEALDRDIAALIYRYRSEFDISYASAIGVLMVRAQMLAQECADRFRPDESDDD